ncbi:hypothetical protein ACJRO7_003188 [Eucalyptus globulus]|uniref:Uncharacterized protein n=1 Tax=Eucalyptus globulus TaxID=34317 RepID=A0ABD3ITG3_EUCGL
MTTMTPTASLPGMVFSRTRRQPPLRSTPWPTEEADSPVLPPLMEMQPEEGFKEKMEKELLNQIIDEADETITCENNKTTNRRKVKLFLASLGKFHTEADKNFWKAIAELLPNEIPTIENKRGKKDQREEALCCRCPKPGKPTEISRMQQILLKHNAPSHLKLCLPSAPNSDGPKVGGAAVVDASEKGGNCFGGGP